MRQLEKIPVTVITGFLGAGKTTFINNILKENVGCQFALVENEFGEIAIDTTLIKGVDASQMFELKQGCICCTILDEYEQVLQELASRFSEVEHLLIETTGVADPVPVVQPFLKDEELKELYAYNGTICLVDAVNFNVQPKKEISIKQLAVADKVIVNKSENCSQEEKQALQEEIKKINPLAKITFVEFANASSIQLNTILVQKHKELQLSHYSLAHSYIKTKAFVYNKPLNKNEFLRWLSYTLDIYKSKIYRCKGVVYFQNEPFEYVLQAVGGSFELEEGNLILDVTESKLVFIGELDNLNLNFEA